MSSDLTIRRVDTDDPNAPEITHIAVVQLYGLCVDNAVLSKGFPGHDEAARWVRDQVEEAHGGLAYMWLSVAPVRYDLGGSPQRFTLPITWISTPEGPTNGFVVGVEATTEITKDNEANN